MIKKRIVFSFVIVGIIIFICMSLFNAKEKVEKVQNVISKYIYNNSKFQFEIPKNIEIKYDKKTNVYISTITFENNPNKAHIIVSSDNLILNDK